MNEYLKERSKYWPVSPELMASYDDGSHTETVNGALRWYKDGQLHRDGDKPAWIDADGTLVWYKNGQIHRDGDKPALIDASGALWWFKNGVPHRDGDLPAWISANGDLEWCKNGLRHRDGDKPAGINATGTLRWFKNGLRHRITGPAVISPTVIRPNYEDEYWINGVDITKEVNSWLETRQYKYPFTPEQQVEFTQTFG
jgi:hypothetical protein